MFFSYRCYDDDPQVTLSFPWSCFCCMSRMAAHRLKRNPLKTWAAAHPWRCIPCQGLMTSLDNSPISPSVTTCIRGVLPDRQTFLPHITKLTRFAGFYQEDADISLHRLDYCILFPVDLLLCTSRPLRLIQDAALWLVSNLPITSSTIPLLHTPSDPLVLLDWTHHLSERHASRLQNPGEGKNFPCLSSPKDLKSN